MVIFVKCDGFNCSNLHMWRFWKQSQFVSPQSIIWRFQTNRHNNCHLLHC